MPYKSRSQVRWMFAAQARGDIPKGTAERWAKHTPNIKALPEKKAFLIGFDKAALRPAHIDLAGLGILAAPSAKELVTGKDMNPKVKAGFELAGLGTLAAASLKHLKDIKK